LGVQNVILHIFAGFIEPCKSIHAIHMHENKHLAYTNTFLHKHKGYTQVMAFNFQRLYADAAGN